MKELNFNFELKGLDGSSLNENAGKLLANVLSSDTGKNPVKFWGWAQLIFSGKSINIDGQDMEILKNLIMDNNQLTALSKSQLLEAINK